MSGPVRAATVAALWWNRCYTAWLPEAVRSTRRAELLSDLHEHAARDRGHGADPADTAVVMLWRVVTGAPADLAWRWSVARATSPGIRSTSSTRIPTMFATIARRAGLAFVVAIALFLGTNGVGALIEANGEGWRITYGLINLTSAVLVLGGLALQTRRPAAGTVTVALGIALSSLSLYWMLPITLPLAAIGGGALFLQWRHRHKTAAVAAG